MTIATILVPVDGSATAHSALETAFTVGRDWGVRVEVLHVRSDSRDAVTLLGGGISAPMVEEMIGRAEQEALRWSEQARTQFEEVRARFAPPDGGEIVADWIEVVGHVNDEVARRGRLADLVVVGRSIQEMIPADTLNAALFETGRPVLLAPPKPLPSLGRRVAVAWNGSTEAARAVTAALPFLARAQAVTVVTAVAGDSGAASDMTSYLALHGVDAAIREVPLAGLSVGEALLDAVAQMEADLLVMGAYTHSRMREMILGGVTRHMLDRTEIPLLMAH